MELELTDFQARKIVDSFARVDRAHEMMKTLSHTVAHGGTIRDVTTVEEYISALSEHNDILDAIEAYHG